METRTNSFNVQTTADPVPAQENPDVQTGVEQNVTVSPEAVTEEQPEQVEKEVEDTDVIFVPFEDFDGRINQSDFHFRENIPTKVPKAEANVWLEAKKGYIK